MKPAPPDPAELVHRMRQQLILVQVRIMELEDARDEAGNRLAECQQLLRAAQTIADQKLDEAAHLEEVRAGLQAQYEHLRHVQHVTNEALNATRADLTAATHAVAAGQQTIADLEARLARLTEAHGRLEALHRTATGELRESAATAAVRDQRIAELDREVRAMKSSRSWRWTAWLRSIERQVGGRKP
jgi:chromosome segregation ATPase